MSLRRTLTVRDDLSQFGISGNDLLNFTRRKNDLNTCGRSEDQAAELCTHFPVTTVPYPASASKLDLIPYID